MAKRFEDKTVIVTGASSGVGAAAARLFSAEGAFVVLAARTAVGLEAVAKEIGGQTLVVPTDVGDPDQARALIDEAVKARGGIDVLVNNAGYNHRGPVVDADPAELARIVDVNLRGPILLTRFALPALLQQTRASVVNVASIAGQVPLPGEATYSGTKFGLRGFSMALAEELRGTNVRVSLVSPGPIETGFITDDLDAVPDIVFSQPMSSAEDVARAILDCAEDGRMERTLPRVTGLLATAGYLVPEIPRLLRPLLEQQGRRAKERYRKQRE